jgi:hypothetical protein
VSNEVKIPVSLPGAAQASADAANVAAGLQGVAASTDAVGAAAKRATHDQKSLNDQLRKATIKDEVAQAKLDSDPLGAKRLKGAASEAESAVDALGRRGSAAKDVYEGLTATMQGGTGVVFGLSKAWSNLSAAMASNPLAAIAAALLALKPLFDAVITRITTLDAKLFGSGQRTAAISAGFKQIEQDSKTAMAAASTAVDKLITTFGRLLAQQKANASQLQAIKDAETDVKVADIDRQEAIDIAGAKTPAERDAIKANADRQRTVVRRTSEDEKLARADEESRRQSGTLRTERKILEKKQAQAEAEAKRLADEAKAKESTASKFGRLAPGSDVADETFVAAVMARKKAMTAADRAKELREKNAPRLAEIDLEAGRLSDDRDAVALRRRANAKRAEGELVTSDRAISESQERLKQERAIADIAKAGETAARSRGLYQPEQFKPDFFADSKTNERGAAAVAARNSDRRSSISAAREGIEDAVADLKNPGGEEAELQRLEAALRQLVQATQGRERQTIQTLVARIVRIESQLKNGDR